ISKARQPGKLSTRSPTPKSADQEESRLRHRKIALQPQQSFFHFYSGESALVNSKSRLCSRCHRPHPFAIRQSEADSSAILNGANCEAQALPTRSRDCKLRGGPKISRRMIALRNPAAERRSVAMSVPVRAAFVFGSVSIAYASTADLMEAGSSRGGGASGRSEIGAGTGNFVGSTICLFLLVRTSRTVGIGGCTGARGRGGISVRGTTGRGGVEVGGCP